LLTLAFSFDTGSQHACFQGPHKLDTDVISRSFGEADAIISMSKPELRFSIA